jgi:hypothetical protein
LTGRSFLSVRRYAQGITDRWGRASRLFLQQKQQCGSRLADMGKDHSSEAFFGCDDPLEAVLFSALLEIHKMQDGNADNVDP